MNEVIVCIPNRMEWLTARHAIKQHLENRINETLGHSPGFKFTTGAETDSELYIYEHTLFPHEFGPCEQCVTELNQAITKIGLTGWLAQAAG